MIDLPPKSSVLPDALVQASGWTSSCPCSRVWRRCRCDAPAQPQQPLRPAWLLLPRRMQPAKTYPCVCSASDQLGEMGVALRQQPLSAQDARPVFQVFKSVLIGPHLYAGLTSDSRVIVADPAKITSLVSPASSEGGTMLHELPTSAGWQPNTCRQRDARSGGLQLMILPPSFHMA